MDKKKNRTINVSEPVNSDSDKEFFTNLLKLEAMGFNITKKKRIKKMKVKWVELTDDPILIRGSSFIPNKKDQK